MRLKKPFIQLRKTCKPYKYALTMIFFSCKSTWSLKNVSKQRLDSWTNHRPSSHNDNKEIQWLKMKPEVTLIRSCMVLPLSGSCTIGLRFAVALNCLWQTVCELKELFIYQSDTWKRRVENTGGAWCCSTDRFFLGAVCTSVYVFLSAS